MVDIEFACESSRFPAFHAGGYIRYSVDCSGPRCHVPSDLLEAFAAEYLARTGDVLYTHKSVVVTDR